MTIVRKPIETFNLDTGVNLDASYPITIKKSIYHYDSPENWAAVENSLSDGEAIELEYASGKSVLVIKLNTTLYKIDNSRSQKRIFEANDYFSISTGSTKTLSNDYLEDGDVIRNTSADTYTDAEVKIWYDGNFSGIILPTINPGDVYIKVGDSLLPIGSGGSGGSGISMTDGYDIGLLNEEDPAKLRGLTAGDGITITSDENNLTIRSQLYIRSIGDNIKADVAYGDTYGGTQAEISLYNDEQPQRWDFNIGSKSNLYAFLDQDLFFTFENNNVYHSTDSSGASTRSPKNMTVYFEQDKVGGREVTWDQNFILPRDWTISRRPYGKTMVNIVTFEGEYWHVFELSRSEPY